MTGRRKSGRKPGSSKKETPEKTRRSSRRRGQKKSESEDDSGSEKSVDEREETRESPKKEPDLSKEDESAGSDGAWQVRSENGNKGGIPKLKISLHRPAESSPTPSEPLSSPRPRRSRRGAANEEASEDGDDTAGPSKDSSVGESSENESERRPSRSKKRNQDAGSSKDTSAEIGEDESVSNQADDSAQRAKEAAERERQEEVVRLEKERQAEEEKRAEQERQRKIKEAEERDARLKAKEEEEKARKEAERVAKENAEREEEERRRKAIEEKEKQIREEEARKRKLEEEEAMRKKIKEEKEARRKSLEEKEARRKSLEEKETRRKSLEEKEAKKKKLEEEEAEAKKDKVTHEEQMEVSVEEQEKDTGVEKATEKSAASEERADSDVEVMASRTTSEGRDGRRRSRRSPSRDSSEERAKQAALDSRRPKEATGSEDGEVPDSPEREISFPVRTEGKLRTSANASNTKENQDQPVVRKRRWGSSNSSQPAKKPLSISTDILKEIIPEVKPVALSEVQLTLQKEEVVLDDDKAPQERSRSSKAEEAPRSRRRRDVSSDESEKDYEEEAVDSDGEEMVKKRPPTANHAEVQEEVKELKETSVELPMPVRKALAPDPLEALTKQRSPSPAKHPESNVLFITNLVRPFTVVQLRDLLARTGTIADEKGFWIDPIKSKCYVKYTSEEDAKNTRHALHGVRWPVSNPKQLNVDFSTEAAMTNALEGGRPAVADERHAAIEERRQREKEREVREKERRLRDEKEPTSVADRLGDLENGRQVRRVSDRERERERDRDRGQDKDVGSGDRQRRDEKSGRTVRKVTLPVREWDLGKAERGFSPPAEESRHLAERKRDHGRQNSPSPEPHKKSRKRDDVTPQKRLLDDLFRKTKTTPAIYWLPLTDQQIAEKEAQRRKHMEENEKRIAEVKKRREVKDGKRRRSRSRSPKK